MLPLAEGTRIPGVSKHIIKNCESFVWRTRDDGKTWNERYEAACDSVPKDYPETLFGDAQLWRARSGRLWAILWVGAGNTGPIAGTTDPGNNGQSERMIVYSTGDMVRHLPARSPQYEVACRSPATAHLKDARKPCDPSSCETSHQRLNPAYSCPRLRWILSSLETLLRVIGTALSLSFLHCDRSA